MCVPKRTWERGILLKRVQSHERANLPVALATPSHSPPFAARSHRRARHGAEVERGRPAGDPHRKTPPPVAARNLAIMHLAMFDALMAIERTHQPYLVDTTAPPGTSREAAVAAAAHRTLVGLFPKEQKTST